MLLNNQFDFDGVNQELFCPLYIKPSKYSGTLAIPPNLSSKMLKSTLLSWKTLQI